MCAGLGVGDRGPPSSMFDTIAFEGSISIVNTPSATQHPYSEGVALIGDAASSNDPAWGNGLALTLRDVRALADALSNGDDWDNAGREYANAHAEYFGVIRRVTRWMTALLYEVGPEADARRDRAFPLMQRDRSRSLDYIALGPDCPSDEAARARFFGES